MDATDTVGHSLLTTIALAAAVGVGRVRAHGQPAPPKWPLRLRRSSPGEGEWCKNATSAAAPPAVCKNRVSPPSLCNFLPTNGISFPTIGKVLQTFHCGQSLKWGKRSI